tara:strand:- start:3442 stop:3669 length:228 start_codon:yes stop_codon:yes gene_type:complete
MANDERKFVFTPDDYRELEGALESTYSGALACRDKIKQAEAMEELYDQSALHKVINRGALINRARNLRRQAEGEQ